MFIKEIVLKNFMNVPDTHLQFQCASPIYLVHGAGDGPLRNALPRAIEVICSSKYDDISTLSGENLLDKGVVRIVFRLMLEVGSGDAPGFDILDNTYEDVMVNFELSDEDDDKPCTSKQAMERYERRKQKLRIRKAQMWNDTYHTLDVTRDFAKNAEVVTYRLNDLELVTCTLPDFQARFQLNVDYLMPRLTSLELTQNFVKINWLEMLNEENANCSTCAKQSINNLFKRFAKLFESKSHDAFIDLTKTCVTTYNCLSHAQKISIIQTFADVRVLFEYLTNHEFTIYFLMPTRGALYELSSCKLDEIEFSKMHTIIQPKSNRSNELSEQFGECSLLQDLLLIAFQLELAFFCKQRIVYISNLNYLGKYKSDQLMCLMYTRNIHATDFSRRNYIQRIADLAIYLGLMAIMEYSDNLCLDMKKVNTIKCSKCPQTAEWSMIIQQEDIFDLQTFTKVIQQRFFQH